MQRKMPNTQTNDYIKVVKEFEMDKERNCYKCYCERCKLCWLFTKSIPDMKPCQECLEYKEGTIVKHCK